MIVRLVDARDVVREVEAPWRRPALRPRWFVHDGLRFDASDERAGVWTFRSRQAWPVDIPLPWRPAVVIDALGTVLGSVDLPFGPLPSTVAYDGSDCALWCVKNQAGQVEYRHGG